ncbi:MAG: hypothetical protein UW69_C0054G0001 [Microgenomates group bacterium GW2011_GWA2_44_7]|nr:MAG: hypothetical protein UW69_C0054G0001 [Microgenomates group bacterium GW2011_GWA2_44_7]KKT77324.1 MAG: hypothetical protein UW73_C0023G0029 [Microgenomates group bacterium GW2011_GWB1_44_8]
MVTRKKASTFKKSLKTPPSIVAPGGPPIEPEETLATATQLPQSQPFEVKVEVEKPEVPAQLPQEAAQQQAEPEPAPVVSSPEESTAEANVPEEVIPENTAPQSLEVQEVTNVPSSGRKWLWIIVGLVVLLIIGGGIYTYVKSMKSAGGAATPTPSQTTPVSTPTSSPSAQLNRTDVKIQVLNGTSVIGLAARAKAYLLGLGYEEVAVGNAKDNDLSETTIAIKEDKEEFLDLLTQDIGAKYPLAKESETLDSSSPYDAVITLGQP